MSKKRPLVLDIEQCVDHIVHEFGNDIRIVMPLGLGKPVPLINARYRRAKKNSAIERTLFTALSLKEPIWNALPLLEHTGLAGAKRSSCKRPCCSACAWPA